MPLIDQSDAFYGPLLKVERAQHHIEQLEIIFRELISENMRRMRSQKHQRTPKPSKLRGLPRHTPTILGDAIHNLRASLDHAYHIAADANGAVFSDYRTFPFRKDRQSLEDSINGHRMRSLTPSEKVISVIVDEIQPYAGGKLALYNLHKLDITDKHLVLIPTSTRMNVDKLDFVGDDGRVRRGVLGGFSMISDNPGFTPNFISVTGGSLVMPGDPKDAFAIVFQEGQPFAGASILETIYGLKRSTESALSMISSAL